MHEAQRDQGTNRLQKVMEIRRASLAAVSQKERTAELSFSSEEPCRRSYGWEVLSHSDGAADLSRLNSGRANCLLNHDPDRWCGVVVSARIENRKGIAVVRFSESERGREVFADVSSGILQSVSVGYQVHKVQASGRATDGETIFTATSWMPYEISMVSVPADASVGVGARHPQQPLNKVVSLGAPIAQRAEVAAAAEQPDFQTFCRQQARRNGGVFGNSFYFGG